jgi:hypothetical protein
MQPPRVKGGHAEDLQVGPVQASGTVAGVFTISRQSYECCLPVLASDPRDTEVVADFQPRILSISL